MEELVFYIMVLLATTRLIGVITFTDLFHRTGRKSFLFLILGWFIYSLSPIVNLLSDNNSETWLYSIYCYLAALGSIIIVFAGIRYFAEVKTKLIVVSLFMATLMPFIAYLITSSYSASCLTSDSIQFICLVLALALVLKKQSSFKEIAGNSFYWFVAIVTISFINAAGYLFYYSDETIGYGYVLAIEIPILVIIFFIHLEHNISIKKSALLKDRYSHDLGNIIQIIMGEVEVINISEESQSYELQIIKEKCFEAAEHIKNIRKL